MIWLILRLLLSGAAIAMIDIDRFKTINDTYGHATGDQILVEVAWRSPSVRLTMWGAGAARNSWCNISRTITVSVGLAAIYGSANVPLDLDALIQHADEALYRAKADGRNAARIAEVEKSNSRIRAESR